MRQAELMREVEQVIEDKLANNEPAAMSWIVHEVIRRRDGIVGPDSDFYKLCGYEHVRDTTREVLRRCKEKEGAAEPDQHDLFPGFKHIQRRYTIQRGEEQFVVRLENLDVEEIRGKARELRGMAAGCLAHAQELEDYIGIREQAA